MRPNHPCTGQVLKAQDRIYDANQLHILKLTNQDRSSVKGFFLKIRSSHTKDRHLLGAFGYFMSGKK